METLYMSNVHAPLEYACSTKDPFIEVNIGGLGHV